MSLLTNHYEINKIPDISIYQYAIGIIADGLPADRRLPIKVCRDIMQSAQVQQLLEPGQNTFVYDGILSPHLTNVFRKEHGMEQSEDCRLYRQNHARSG
jgi:hypothetical protein